jgi:hypothetical protein
MATQKMQGGIVVDGLRQTLAAMNRLDKDAKDAVKEEVQKVANLLARELQVVGRSRGGRDAIVASSIRGTRERTPVVKVGYATIAPISGKPRISDLMFGMEFGSSGQGVSAVDFRTVRGGRPGWRFPDRTPRKGRGNEGYWLFKTLSSQGPRVVDLWAGALEKAMRRWAE